MRESREGGAAVSEATKLTRAQKRMLAEVRAAGSMIYSGRARRTIEALAIKGLVDYEYELPASRYTVRPRPQASQRARRDVAESFARILEHKYPGTRWRPVEPGTKPEPGAVVRRLVPELHPFELEFTTKRGGGVRRIFVQVDNKESARTLARSYQRPTETSSDVIEVHFR
jgi:hypothetical protein